MEAVLPAPRFLIDRDSVKGKCLLNVLPFLPAIVLGLLAIPLLQHVVQVNKKATYYEAVVQNLARPIVVVDSTGKILLANTAAKALLESNVPGGTVEGQSVETFLPWQVGESADLLQLRDLADHSPDHEFQLPLRRLDGKTFMAQIGVRQLQDPFNNTVYVAVIEPIEMVSESFSTVGDSLGSEGSSGNEIVAPKIVLQAASSPFADGATVNLYNEYESSPASKLQVPVPQ